MAKKIDRQRHTERYCFLYALCGSKPFQKIIKSLIKRTYPFKDVWKFKVRPGGVILKSRLKPEVGKYLIKDWEINYEKTKKRNMHIRWSSSL